MQYVFCDSKHSLREEAEGNSAPLRHALDTLVTRTLGLAWIASLSGKIGMGPVLRVLSQSNGKA